MIYCYTNGGAKSTLSRSYLHQSVALLYLSTVHYTCYSNWAALDRPSVREPGGRKKNDNDVTHLRLVERIFMTQVEYSLLASKYFYTVKLLYRYY